ncbi:MAG: glycosyltransferase [Candidatus Rokubacteria bacterium]|nr:glycosyltransferase [Candidatus Rokubacteria bacterium]
MTRVLILTASYGSGHNEAARSLAAAFAAERAEVTIVDHFRDLVHPTFERLSRALYYGTLRRAPTLWGSAYALGDWMASDSPLALGVTRLGMGRLRRLLRRLAPDVVVTVHATPAVVMSCLAWRGTPVPPHTTVVTDFVAHGQWLAPHTDRYCVAADEVKHEFIARGIPRDRILVTGVPVRAEFDEPADPATARRTLGLSREVPVVLAMAGAQGSFGRLPHVARVLGDARGPLQGLVVAGQDARLRAALDGIARGTRVRVLGHVPNVRQLMAAADLLITKAGGMTLAEALAAELPLLLYGSLPGQERRNERFASRTGIALVARRYRELTAALERALGDPELLDHLRQRMRRLRRPDASRRVVAAVLERATRPT